MRETLNEMEAQDLQLQAAKPGVETVNEGDANDENPETSTEVEPVNEGDANDEKYADGASMTEPEDFFKVDPDGPTYNRFTIRFVRDDLEASLGMGINSLTGLDLYVESVKAGGFVEKWNKANPSMTINEGDTIVQVNDVEGDPEKMVQELQMETVCLGCK